MGHREGIHPERDAVMSQADLLTIFLGHNPIG